MKAIVSIEKARELRELREKHEMELKELVFSKKFSGREKALFMKELLVGQWRELESFIRRDSVLSDFNGLPGNAVIDVVEFLEYAPGKKRVHGFSVGLRNELSEFKDFKTKADALEEAKRIQGFLIKKYGVRVPIFSYSSGFFNKLRKPVKESVFSEKRLKALEKRLLAILRKEGFISLYALHFFPLVKEYGLGEVFEVLERLVKEGVVEELPFAFFRLTKDVGE